MINPKLKLMALVNVTTRNCYWQLKGPYSTDAAYQWIIVLPVRGLILSRVWTIAIPCWPL